MKNKIKNIKKVSQLYSKSQIPTDDLLEEVPPECVKLKEKVIKIHKKNCKEKLGPTDRIIYPPSNWK